MIQNKDEAVRTTLKDKQVDVNQLKIADEASKRLAGFFKLIVLKRNCQCISIQIKTICPKHLINSNENKPPSLNKLVSSKTQLENLVINNDMLKMYS